MLFLHAELNMKIGIQTWGSNGDIRPMLALADGLSKAGHQVSLVVSSVDNHSYHEICRQLGVAYRQVPESIAFDMQDFALRSFKMHTLQWLRALLDEAYFPHEQEIYQAAQQLTAENDLVIGHHFLYPLKLAAKQQGKDFVSVTFCHGAIANPAFPAFSFPNLGRAVNGLTWALRDAVFSLGMQRLTHLWRQAGVTPPKNLLGDLLSSQTLNLVAVDAFFCPAIQHWPEQHQACGFLNLDEDARHWQMPDSLAEFMDSGPAPVYMTFGSLQQAVPEWSMDLFLEAVALAGCRAVIQTSSERFPALTSDKQVYFIGKHPHQPLFKECVAVVHHGGAGTTHAATRAGCASIVVPFMSEQLFWAEQARRLGLAGKPLPAKSINAASLGKALAMTLASDAIRHSASAAGRSMQTRQGVERAVQLLEARFH